MHPKTEMLAAGLCLHMHRQKINITSGQRLGINELDNSSWRVSFMHDNRDAAKPGITRSIRHRGRVPGNRWYLCLQQGQNRKMAERVGLSARWPSATSVFRHLAKSLYQKRE